MSPRRTMPPLREQWAEVVAAVRAELAIDRLELTPAVSRGRIRWAAWASIVVLFIWGWGGGTVRAVDALMNGTRTPTPLGPDTVFVQTLAVASDIALAATAIGLIFVFRGGFAPPAPWVTISPRTYLYAIPVALAVLTLGMGIMQAPTLVGIPFQPFPSQHVDGILANVLWGITLAMAGPTEEAVLLGLVVTALRRSGYSWTVVGIVAVLVRIPFHLYYGWGAILLAVWALLFVALYRRTGTIVPMVIAHTVFNIAALPPFGDVGLAIKVVILLVSTVLTLWMIWRRTMPKPAPGATVRGKP